MDFIDAVRQLSSQAERLIDQLHNEEETKQALILPFLQLLGYNIFDPSEVRPEFTADVGTKKGEKVDYAILVDGRPLILIEAKAVNDPLVSEAESQLYRYFAVTEAKFAILTNGIVYKFFSDLAEPNKMDREPFFEFNLLSPKEPAVAELKKFHRTNLNVSELSATAAVLKYTNRVQKLLDQEMREPSDDFVRFWVERIYDGRINQRVLERFRPIVKRSLSQYVSDLISEKLKSALEATAASEREEAAEVEEGVMTDEPDEERGVETTLEELEAFFIVKAILRKRIDPQRVGYKDTKSRFNIVLDGKVSKWICRLRLGPMKKVVIFPGEGGAEERVVIERVDDLYAYEQRLLDAAARLAP